MKPLSLPEVHQDANERNIEVDLMLILRTGQITFSEEGHQNAKGVATVAQETSKGRSAQVEAAQLLCCAEGALAVTSVCCAVYYQ